MSDATMLVEGFVREVKLEIEDEGKGELSAERRRKAGCKQGLRWAFM